ncbi:tetratricopeptide repeat protein [Maridesulfovibrio ferrireducens]|uniref:tetratricopeptide repeat protein n=1 Tax=Maridesulfovibrio ferrireducens TaxID=246191 RepID=UPI001A198FA9|nr:tetratricopeptide repeat protein [Maridesulfovibrio ferrireducens]MBI9112730.1 tetratricopeptide repeat protein [Maridesulfovibrio ferrireducens]
MIYPASTHCKAISSAAILAIFFVIALSGCAAKTGINSSAANPQLTPETQLTFDYLVYQDYLSRLSQIMRSGDRSQEASLESARLQQEAIVVVDRILKVDPRAQLYAEKASLFWAAQQIDEAREALKEGLKKFPEDRKLIMSLSSTYLVENRTTDAESVLQEYIHKHPNDLVVITQLARILLEQKKFAQALDTLKVIPAEKRTTEILYYYAKASAGLGLTKQAIRALQKAVKVKPDYLEAWGELAYLYELGKDYDAAEKIYTKMLEFPEASNHIRLRLIELSLKLNNPDRGLSLVLEGPRNTAFLLDSAQIFLNSKFYGQASTILDIFVLEKEIPDAYYFFKASIAYEGEEDPAKALNFLNKVKPSSDHYDRSLQFKAHLLIDLKKDKEALTVLRKGQEQFPDNPNFFLIEASLHIELKQPEKAEETLLRGYKNIPDSPQILFQLGIIEERKGNIDNTLKYMEKIISIHPDHADALNYVGYILADRNEQLDRAMVLISRANKLEPDNGFIIDSLAWVHYRLGNFDEAWKNIGRALSLQPRQPELWEHYGDIALAMGNKKEAAKAYKRALKFDPENKELRRKLDSL